MLSTKSHPRVSFNIAHSYYDAHTNFKLKEIGFKVAWAMENSENSDIAYDDPEYVMW